MKRHLTEKELIEYRFRLASEEQAAASAEHVAGCAECRERLEQLDRKFAALDLLREDVHASEELIAQVIEQTKGAAKAKVVSFRTLRWIGAVAAVLIVGFVLFIGDSTQKGGGPEGQPARIAGEKSEVAYSSRRSKGPENAPVESLGRSMTSSKPKSDSSATLAAGTKAEIEAAVDMDADKGQPDTFAFAAPKDGPPVGGPFGARLQQAKPAENRSELAMKSIPEQAPFAPASAIELVTLPRRESVQLTIYNTSDSAQAIGGVRFGGSGMMGGFREGRRYLNSGLSNRQSGGLTTVVQETIEPDSWYDLSDTGEGTIEIHDKKLVVRQTPEVHLKIEKFLQALRGRPFSRTMNDSTIAIDQHDKDRIVYQQLDRIVDLSALKPRTSFNDAIKVIKNSVDPPLNIVVLWRDLLEMAEVEHGTEINMDGPAGVRLGTGLKLLLQAVSSEFAEIHHVIKDGVITIATIDTLPENLETRVYDISGLESDAEESKAEQSNRQNKGENTTPRRSPRIVSNSLTLVRERRDLTLKKGWNWLQFMWANTLIDPTSLSLEPLEQSDQIDIQQLVFPARLRELGRWLIRSEISGQVPFEITYFTSGLSWRAFYMGTLSQDEKTMHLAGYVRVANNSGEDYENAQTRLVVGKVHLLDQIAELARRQYPYDRPGISFREGFDLDVSKAGGGMGGMGGMGGYGGGMMGGMGGMAPKEIRKEGLSEYFLYTIEGTETIPNEWGKRLLSFEADDIAVESLYKYDEERWGSEAIRFVTFSNDEEHNLGQTPIPNGMVRIYGRADEEGFLSYVGGTEVKYIPVGDEVELNLGPARLVKIEPKLMDFKTDNYVFDNRGNISGWDEIRSWKIEMTNTRTLPVDVEITRNFDTAYWTLQTDVAYKKHDATHARFEVTLEPRSKRVLEYTVTTYHGEREQTVTQ